MVLSVTSAALYRYGLHYNVLLEMMMSVLQKVKGLTKFIILPVGRPVSMQNFKLNVYTVYLFLHRYSLHYNVSSGMSFHEKCYAYALENLFICKISGPKLLRLLSYASS